MVLGAELTPITLKILAGANTTQLPLTPSLWGNYVMIFTPKRTQRPPVEYIF